MKQIPILFSTPMVQAILAGNKTQTRRVKGLEFINETPDQFIIEHTGPSFLHINGKSKEGWGAKFVSKSGLRYFDIAICPYGQPGDVLWVRETTGRFAFGGQYSYKTDDNDGEVIKWKPSIHMPKAAARIWLQIESIRVERLKDISEEDARHEGVFNKYLAWKGTEHESTREGREFFKNLWQSINGEESWNANPWVWAITFKVLSTTGKPTL